MINIPLQPIPNQSLSFVQNSQLFDLIIKSTNLVTCATVFINNVLIISNTRIITGFPLLPYEYLENGNLVLLTANDALPDYRQFGVTQNLIYATQAELNAIRAI